jgi:hypothetical protein
MTDFGEVKGGCKFTWSGYLELARVIESLTEQRLSGLEETAKHNNPGLTVANTADTSRNVGSRRHRVNMTYFKKSGKFYDEAWISVPGDMELHQIWELVRRMRSEGRLEGLVEGAGREFMILVNVPGHPHEHPHIIV